LTITWERRSGSPWQRAGRPLADAEVEAAGEGALGREGDGAVDDLARVDGDLLDAELAGLDLGRVEHVVDDAQQVLARFDDADELLAGLPGAVPLPDLGEPEDGVEGVRISWLMLATNSLRARDSLSASARAAARAAA
jgi:hypothetical protein